MDGGKETKGIRGMTRKRKQRQEGEAPAGEVGSGRGKKGYRWLKAWVDRYAAADRPPGEEGERELEQAGDQAGWWVRWLPRLFVESDPDGRKRILRWVAPMGGKDAVGFLAEVLAAKESTLEERELALACLEGLGEVPGGGVEEGLAQVRRFVDGFGAAEADADAQAGEGDLAGLRDRFNEIPGPYRGLALRELVQRYPDRSPWFVGEVLGGEGGQGMWEEIVDLLEEAPDEGWAKLLAAGYKDGDKAVRKMIRRVQYKRTLKGLAVVPLEQDEGPAVWKPPEMASPEGLITMPGGDGTRLVVVMRPNVPKGMLIFTGLIQDEVGMADFVVVEMTRKASERHKASLLGDRDLGFVEADAGLCAYRLEKAFERGFVGDQNALEVYRTVRPLLKELLPADPFRAPIYAVYPEELEEGVTEDRLGISADLLEDERLSGWAVSPRRAAPYVEGLEEIKESRIIVSSLQKKDRLEEFFRKATAEIFSDQAYRAGWKARLEDAAWVFFKEGVTVTARRLAALARFLEDADRDASKIPFFVELVRRRLEERLEDREQRRKEIPSLIVKPT